MALPAGCWAMRVGAMASESRGKTMQNRMTPSYPAGQVLVTIESLHSTPAGILNDRYKRFRLNVRFENENPRSIVCKCANYLLEKSKFFLFA